MFIIWIHFNAVLQPSDSIPEKFPVLSASGDPDHESSLTFSTESISGKNLTSSFHETNSDIFSSNPDDNLEKTSLLYSDTTRFEKSDNNLDVVPDTTADAGSSDIWSDYLDAVGGHSIADPKKHLHYEVVTTSSKSNLCRIQCIAWCGSNSVRVHSQ